MKRIIAIIFLLTFAKVKAQEEGNHSLELRVGFGSVFYMNTTHIDDILKKNNLPGINLLPIINSAVEFNYWYKNFGISVGTIDYQHRTENDLENVYLYSNVETYMSKIMWRVLKSDILEIVPYVGLFSTYGSFHFENVGNQKSIDEIINDSNLSKPPTVKRDETGFNAGLLCNYKIYKGEIFDILLGVDVMYLGTFSEGSHWIINDHRSKDKASDLSNINTNINIGFRYKI